MSNCCQATAAHFDGKRAEQNLATYRTKGLKPTTSAILSLLRDSDLAEASSLEIGSGIGMLSFELLGRGVRSSTMVDMSSACLGVARSEAARRGVQHQVSLVHGDAAELSADLQPADLVALDRVLCCYPDLEQLIAASVSKAKKWYVVSYPRRRWFVRLGVALENFVRRVKGNPFRSFVHDPARIRDLVVSRGFEIVDQSRTPAWEIELYRGS